MFFVSSPAECLAVGVLSYRMPASFGWMHCVVSALDVVDFSRTGIGAVDVFLGVIHGQKPERITIPYSFRWFFRDPVKSKFRGYSGSGPTDQFGILCYSLALESFLHQLVVRSGRLLKIASSRVRYPLLISLGRASGWFFHYTSCHLGNRLLWDAKGLGSSPRLRCWFGAWNWRARLRFPHRPSNDADPLRLLGPLGVRFRRRVPEHVVF